MVWIVMFLALTLVNPTLGYAETVEVKDGEGNIVDIQEVEEGLNDTGTAAAENSGIVTGTPEVNLETTEKTLGEISGKLDRLKDIDDGLTDVEKRLKKVQQEIVGVSGQVDGLIMQQANPEIKAVERLTASNQTFNCYANVSPNSAYAIYAKQTVPKMGWEDDYVYFQDTSSSYVLVWGNLDYRSAGTFTGTNAHYSRWYYSGTGTGYLVQSGVGNVTVNVNNYVVLSSLGDYPLLDDGFTLFRQEVCFYACVATVLFCLYHIWSFLLRNRK